MSDSQPVVEELDGSLSPARGGARLGRVVRSRYRDRDFALRRALLVADMLGLWIALLLTMAIAGRRGQPVADSLWIAPTLPAWALLFWAYRLYGRQLRRFEPTHIEDIPSLFHALVLGTLGLWLSFRLVPPVPRLSLEEVLVFGLLALPLVAVLRAVLRAGNLRLQGPERVFAVAPAEDVRLLQRKLANHREYEMELVGAVGGEADHGLGLELSAELDQVEGLLASGQVDHVMARLDATYVCSERLEALMRACHLHGVRFSCFPPVRGLLPPGIEVNHLEGMGIVTSYPPVLPRMSRTVKRGMDVSLSAALLIAFAPLMALVAAAIKFDSKGPVLYRQTRVGRNERRFQLVKFRTMVDDADRMTAELMERSTDSNWLFLEDDPRVTRIGRLLRRTSIDELPQLWNVLKGEMSMVGPRPLSERDDRNVRGWHRHRLELVPGITGYWQVLGRTSIPFEEMLEVDYAYVANWSLWHDVKLLLQTVPAVLGRRGVN